MSLRDALTNLGTIDFASTPLATGGQIRFPDTLDLGRVLQDIGVGQLLMAEFHVETTVTATGLYTMGFCLWSTSVPTISSATLSTGGATNACMFAQSGLLADNGANFGVMKAYAGTKVYLPIPPWPTYDLTNTTIVIDAARFSPLRYIVASAFGFPATAGTMNAGTVSARVLLADASWRPHPSGYSIS